MLGSMNEEVKYCRELSPEEQMLADAAREASAKAVAETFALGLPITVAKGDKIVRIYPDGKEEIIGDL